MKKTVIYLVNFLLNYFTDFPALVPSVERATDVPGDCP